jgi:hypothetical protein
MVAFLWKLSLELCLWASIVLQLALHALPCFGTYLENIDTYYVAFFFFWCSKNRFEKSRLHISWSYLLKVLPIVHDTMLSPPKHFGRNVTAKE